ncbi:MAG: DUF58 domain-containing protein [Gammaproteobacteria bacterium]|nr:DUF58 domain-containing protein [Gammaproteobacteria bacterium]NNC96757.1 DUF58 domain-containing protein [Gammaproteobacteria bacterium]NNM13513.1 DUF58 domain-containing protein [Gammaproteobacteria bacterium]
MTGKKTSKSGWSQRILKRTEKWARNRRSSSDSIPYQVSARRIYIIPTRFGAGYALAVFILLLGAMNYSNSLAFFLTFSLAAIGFIAMHLTHSNLAKLSVEPAFAEPVFAGDPAILKLGLASSDKKLHPEILVSNAHANITSQTVNVEQQDKYASIVLPTHKRGYIEIDQFTLSTRFPMNLFFAWTVAFQTLRCLVYPSPAESAPEVFGETNNSESARSSNRLGQDDFAGLRDYQWQDSPQHIAWKSYASQDKLLVKLFHESVAHTLWFDFDALTANDIEQRLSQLCRLILDADKLKQNYGLRLGKLSIAPGHGEQHKHQCLQALALYDQAAGS